MGANQIVTERQLVKKLRREKAFWLIVSKRSPTFALPVKAKWRSKVGAVPLERTQFLFLVLTMLIEIEDVKQVADGRAVQRNIRIVPGRNRIGEVVAAASA